MHALIGGRFEGQMAIKLKPEAHARFIASIKRFFAETLDEDIGDLKASLVLDFVLEEIGPTLYNRAVADAQAKIQDAALELDSACYEPDLGYWNRR